MRGAGKQSDGGAVGGGVNRTRACDRDNERKNDGLPVKEKVVLSERAELGMQTVFEPRCIVAKGLWVTLTRISRDASLFRNCEWRRASGKEGRTAQDRAVCIIRHLHFVHTADASTIRVASNPYHTSYIQYVRSCSITHSAFSSSLWPRCALHCVCHWSASGRAWCKCSSMTSSVLCSVQRMQFFFC